MFLCNQRLLVNKFGRKFINLEIMKNRSYFILLMIQIKLAVLFIVATSLFAQDPLLPYVNSIPPVHNVISTTNEEGLTLERFTFKSRDSINIVYGILVYPQNTTGKLPGVLVFHGGGSRAEQVVRVSKNYAKRGFISLAIDLPHLCNECPNTTGPFTNAGGGEGPRLNVEGGAENSVLADAMIAALEGFNFLAAHPNTDPDNMGVTGASWGGYTTTMMAGLLKERVKAAYSVFGCGFWDKGSFWLQSLNDLNAENRNTWLTYYDAGRRAAHITANYFIDAPTNDTFFWPIAVQATLDTIPAYTNHVYGPNLDHSQTYLETRYRWMEHYLKERTVPGLARAKTYSAFENNGGREVTFNLNIPDTVSIIESQLWYAVPDVPEPDRNWISVFTQKLDDTTYVAQLTPQMVTAKVQYFGAFKDNYSNWISTEMQFADKLISSEPTHDHDLVVVRKPAYLDEVPVFANNNTPELVIRNNGLNEELNVPVNCEIDSAGIIIYSDSKTIDKIKPFEVRTVTFASWRTFDINTYNLTFYVQLPNDEDESTDTLRSTIIVTNLLDDFESDFENWTTDGSWGTDNRFYYNGEYSMAVNPGLRYENNTDSYALYNYAFDLTSIDDPHLTFWSRSSIYDGDSGFVEISTDGGLNWEMTGKAHSGLQTTWVHNIYSLQNYTEFNDIRFRFHFVSDSVKTHLGWFIDDIKIEDGITRISEKETGHMPNENVLYNNYPNPFNPETVISYRLATGNKVSLKIYDILGQEIETLINKHQTAGKHTITFNAGNLPSGTYIYKFNSGSFEQCKKMILVR